MDGKPVNNFTPQEVNQARVTLAAIGGELCTGAYKRQALRRQFSLTWEEAAELQTEAAELQRMAADMERIGDAAVALADSKYGEAGKAKR